MSVLQNKRWLLIFSSWPIYSCGKQASKKNQISSYFTVRDRYCMVRCSYWKKKNKQKPNQSNKQTRNWFNENFWYFIIYFYLILIMKITTSYQKDVRPTAWRLQFDSGRHRFKILIHILHKPRTFQISSCMSHFLHQCSNWWFLIVVPPVLIFLVLLWISS